MTYCFAFKVNPDGIGVISDMRLSIGESIEDLTVADDYYQKVFNPTSHSFVAIAGTISHIKKVLSGLDSVMKAVPPSQWYEQFTKSLRERYGELISEGYFSDSNSPDVALIYGDLYKRHGGMRTRISKFVFTSENGKPTILCTPPAHKRPVSIGWSSKGQELLEGYAYEAANEFASRPAKVKIVSRGELKRKLGSHAPESNDAIGIEFDTSGVRDFTCLKEFRRVYNELNNTGSQAVWISPVSMLASATLCGIQNGMQHARLAKMEGHECVGNNWNIAIVTSRHGFHIVTHEEKDKIQQFIQQNSYP
ncbi:MAG: hypothetical protein K9M17_04115 [Mariprofundaceae bacterium]|nr:hypothetical protein [Mariprofundaceae bacterium]